MKRLFDIVLAGSSLILLSWLLVLIALLIRVVLGKPVFFKQRRPGLNGKPFLIYKFRTMETVYNSSGELDPDKERMTKFGSWLRQKSLDELPSLWNVFLGDMSIVGPRPLLMEYLDLYTLEQMSRHNVRPGITGWAQVKGRNSLNWDEKFKLDVWYVKNHNFYLDVKIILMTFISVFKSTGITQDGHVTAEKFRGSK
jgi:sugar transferase EpsL